MKLTVMILYSLAAIGTMYSLMHCKYPRVREVKRWHDYVTLVTTLGFLWLISSM